MIQHIQCYACTCALTLRQLTTAQMVGGIGCKANNVCVVPCNNMQLHKLVTHTHSLRNSTAGADLLCKWT